MIGTKRTTAKESESEYLQQQITNTVDNSHRQKTNLFTCVCSLGMFGRATIISDALMNPKYQFLVKEQSRQTLPKHDTNPRNSINQICPKQKTAWQVLWLWWMNQSSTFKGNLVAATATNQQTMEKERIICCPKTRNHTSGACARRLPFFDGVATLSNLELVNDFRDQHKIIAGQVASK